MKIVNKKTNVIIAEVVTNHSMTLVEAIICAGGEFIMEDDDRFDDQDWENVIIDGKRLAYDELDMVW